MKKILTVLFLIIALALNFYAKAQTTIRGTVYDSLGRTPVPLVSVLSTAHTGTVTNDNGQYTITLSDKDSLWFSYLGKATRPFAVKGIKNIFQFDISLRISIPTLEGVKVRPRYYRQDSLENRQAYAKIFDYQKPGLKTMTGDVAYGGAAGFDLDELVNAFRFKRNRRLQAFQSRLIEQEQDGFVKQRFSKALVRRLTPLTDDSLIANFIEMYKPGYYFTKQTDEYTFQQYVKRSYDRYSQGLPPSPLWKEGL